MEAKPTRVLVVDDSADVASALARFIRMQPDMQDAGMRSSADDLAEAVRNGAADVAIVDLTMPGTPPLEAIRELVRQDPGCGVIAYSGYDDDDTIAAALSAGAHVCVSKHAEMAEVLSAIRDVARNAHSV